MKLESIEGLREDFLEFEKENGLFSLEVKDVRFWERVRFNIYQDLTDDLRLRKSNGPEDSSVGVYSVLKIFYLTLRNFIYKNPVFGDQTDILFYGHRRRKKDSGQHEDIYCDPIISELDLDYMYLQEPNNLEHKNPKAENVRYLDFTKFLPKILYKLLKPLYSIGDKREELEKLERDMAERYGVEKNIVEKAHKESFIAKVEKKLNKIYLKILRPKVAVFLVSYTRENQIEACKELGITTVELQHGIIGEAHMGYNYPEGKKSFPDYLFTFGDYWKESAKFPIDDEKIVSMGYPYLEREINRYEDIEPEDQVLFISQPTIGEELSKVALNLSEQDNDYKIVYKLHPKEYDNWRKEYPWLENSNIKIVDNDRKSLYKWFAQSKTQVGVNSTALYEGRGMGLETFIMDISGSSIVKNLFKEENARLVSNAEDLRDNIKLSRSNKNAEKFFKPSSIENFSEEIDSLIKDTY